LKQQEKSTKITTAWLKEGTFYVHGIVYMFVRLSINVTMTMQPFYLEYVTGFTATDKLPTAPQIAIVPLISSVFQLLFSVFLQRRMTICLRNRVLPMLVSIVLVILGSLPFAFLNDNKAYNWVVYLVAPLQGVGLVIMLNTATSLISDVIGSDTANSAFVYGCYGFLYKVANGILIYFLVAYYSDDVNALKVIMTVIPISCAILSYTFTWIGRRFYSDKMMEISE
jgi:Na+/melibiose symporter-like transporter